MNRLETFGLIAAQASRGDLSFPTSVNAALQLQLALNDPDCPIEDALKLILAEPVLAARTVALSNSTVFNRSGGPIVTNVRGAVMRVGYRNLYALAASIVVRQFGSRIVDPELRGKAEQLWEHTAHVAALAQLIARRVTHVNPDTALFAAIVHEVGSFYMLSRADEFPGLLEEDPEHWRDLCEEIVTREVMKKLAIPDPVRLAIEGMRDGMLSIPPDTLLDTLLLANQLAPVASPLDQHALATPRDPESVINFVIDNDVLNAILDESADEVKSMSTALLA